MSRARRRMLSSAAWAVTVALAACLACVRFGVTYQSDAPLGVVFGLCAFLLIVTGVVTGSLRRGTSRLAAAARGLHVPIGVLALAAATAHWHFRWRNPLGLTTALALLVVAFTLSTKRFRRSKGLRRVHKYGGYALVPLVLTHGIQALFFAGN